MTSVGRLEYRKVIHMPNHLDLYLNNGNVERFDGPEADAHYATLCPKMCLTLTRYMKTPPKGVRVPWSDRSVVKAEFDKSEGSFNNRLVVTIGDGSVETFSGCEADHLWIDLNIKMSLSVVSYLKSAPVHTGPVKWPQ